MLAVMKSTVNVIVNIFVLQAHFKALINSLSAQVHTSSAMLITLTLSRADITINILIYHKNKQLSDKQVWNNGLILFYYYAIKDFVNYEKCVSLCFYSRMAKYRLKGVFHYKTS